MIIQGKERRKVPRFVCEGRANVRVMRVESRYQGHLADLSSGGAYILFDGPFRIAFGQRLEIEFEANGLPFRVMGCVRMVEPYCGVGVEFTDISSRGKRQLQELVDELSEGQKAQQRAELPAITPQVSAASLETGAASLTTSPSTPAARPPAALR